MITKIERFNKWRGKKALDEQKFIKSALLVNDYAHSVKNLEDIKTEFSSIKSAQYCKFDKYDRRPLGVVLYCKLEIEEALEQIPAALTQERQLLTNISTILEQFYNKERNNIAEKINMLFANSKQLIELNSENFADRTRARALCVDLYIFLNVAHLAFNNLNMAQRLFVNSLVSLDMIKKEIVNLMRMTESKVEQLDTLLSCEQVLPQQDSTEKTTQDYFNERFLALLRIGTNQEQQLLALEKGMGAAAKDLRQLKAKRMLKEEITLKIQKIHVLTNALKENDNLITGRKYSLELIDAHSESVDIVMENINEFNKAQLNGCIDQLRTPDISDNFSLAMSWMTSAPTALFRYYAPQKIQDISANLFVTLDSECKQRLKKFTKDSLFNLQNKLVGIEYEINRLVRELSKGDAVFEQVLINEENLDSLLNANKAARKAVNEYLRIAKSLENTVLFLNIIRESNKALTTFIQTHDGFWVKLSNFFAQIATIFKSDTAIMIDRAREMTEELDQFEQGYKKELADGMDAIQNNPDVNKAIKDKLSQTIQHDLSRQRETYITTTPKKEDVQYLIVNLKKLFNMNKVNEVPEQKESIPAEFIFSSP